MFCTSCGNQIPEGQAFCTHCGAPAPAAPAEADVAATSVLAENSEADHLSDEAGMTELPEDDSAFTAIGATQMREPVVVPLAESASVITAGAAPKRTNVGLVIALICVVLLLALGGAVAASVYGLLPRLPLVPDAWYGAAEQPAGEQTQPSEEEANKSESEGKEQKAEESEKKPEDAASAVKTTDATASALLGSQAQQNSAAQGGYVIADSSTRELSDADVAGLDAWNLYLARNEIYARHGRQFTNQDLQNHFSSCPWYQGTIAPENFSEELLSGVEKQNIQVIKAREEALGSPYL